jgi:ADP-ribose pyrophosphatase YjhB (NUDIX family)
MLHKSHFGVYALILDRAGRAVLLIKKARGPYTGMLDLPGGSLEDGELLEEALAREIMEETGCRLTTCQQIGAESILFDYTDQETNAPIRLRHIGVLYKASTGNPPRSEADGLDSNGTLWLPLSEIAGQNVTPLVRMAIIKAEII